jgi:hypothetical protein
MCLAVSLFPCVVACSALTMNTKSSPRARLIYRFYFLHFTCSFVSHIIRRAEECRFHTRQPPHGKHSMSADGKTCGVHFVFAMVMMMMVAVVMTRIRDSLLARACLACYYTHIIERRRKSISLQLSGDDQTLRYRYYYLLWS